MELPLAYAVRMNAAPIKPAISKDLLDQVDIRVGTIDDGARAGNGRDARIHFSAPC
jgi:hypothetical protein